MSSLKKNFKNVMNEYEKELLERAKRGDYLTPDEWNTYDLIVKKRKEKSFGNIAGRIARGVITAGLLIAGMIYIAGSDISVKQNKNSSTAINDLIATDNGIPSSKSASESFFTKKEIVEYIINMNSQINAVVEFHNKTIHEFNSDTLDPMEAVSEYGMISQSFNNRLIYNNANYSEFNSNILEIVQVEGEIMHLLSIAQQSSNREEISSAIQKMNYLIKDNRRLEINLLNAEGIEFEILGDGRINMQY
ncbi:hypothetical protein EAL2_808p05860 (plasmid) [Peptoclostridium acidaminophilum DSM 3953]|uniref:Uncharacterized protein n=1 Tax=Peptoclostridium acidaminophilum DSM 3953 TaxID=1286171 RepID=W8T8S2_PEPAC|nr:hypothetical protein [Peptoclostridium acidaminophilum]AHM58089.1 hypothetical protein EAL2_808p05860 [Peptoclostridium acidaminophilum DSM 3953]